jgi:hypothetical protein
LVTVSQYTKAGDVKPLAADDPRSDTVATWVQQRAERDFAKANAEILDTGSVYGRFGGDIQNGIMDPSFALGFSLAYRLFSEGTGMKR